MITDDKKSILERVNFFCVFFIWSDPIYKIVYIISNKGEKALQKSISILCQEYGK